MELAMVIKMFKNSIIICLAALVLIFSFSGCQSSGKKDAKPDRFEKWRILAEKSRGQTPDPRKFDTQIKELEAQTAQKIEAADLKLKEKKIVTPVKPLPDMPVTMKMYDVPVAILLRTLARAADVNIMINETVTGNAKINIKNIPWGQAFTGLLHTYGLTYKWSDDVIRVITVEDLNKEIALMEATQKFERSKKQHAIAMLSIQKEEEKLDPLFTEIVKIDYTDLTMLRDNLEKYLLASKKDVEINKISTKDGKDTKEAVELRGSILMDENTNSLIIQATKSDINKILPIIQKLDRPSHQILIEAHIVEANSDTAKELGIQWGGLGLDTDGGNTWLGGPLGSFDDSLRVSSDDATSSIPAGSPVTHLPNIGNGFNFPSSDNAGNAGWKGLTLGLMNQRIGDYLLYAQLTALAEEGKLNILSKPSITTMDHHKATIESGKEVPFQTIEDGEIKIEFKKAVIKLEVIPHVIDNKVVRLEIITHKDELDWTRTVAGNPTIITKNAETRVTLYDGQTTVIGGLNKEKLQEKELGVPWLKDVPVLGWLFKSNSDAADMEELLIFITPHILKQSASVTIE